MKKLLTVMLATAGLAGTARAQWVVYDPANTIQSVINTAQEVAKFVEVINHQVQQIKALEDQLTEFKHYESLFGDPKAVVLNTVQPLVTELRRAEVGQTLTALEGAVDVATAGSAGAGGQRGRRRRRARPAAPRRRPRRSTARSCDGAPGVAGRRAQKRPLPTGMV